jgi:Ssp1 endopeptidase immunity protein Rap1a
MRRSLIAVLMTFLTAGAASTSGMDGNELKTGLDITRLAMKGGFTPDFGQMSKSIISVAYIQGVVDAHQALYGRSFCGPKDRVGGEALSYDQANDLTLKYLEDHPKIRSSTAAFLVIAALSEAFPCPKK